MPTGLPSESPNSTVSRTSIPKNLTSRSHSEYKEGNDLISMIKEDLVAERIAVESYTAIVRWLGDGDPVTRRLIVDILKVEEEHADDMANLLEAGGGK